MATRRPKHRNSAPALRPADAPKWWTEGALVKVKATPHLRRYGLRAAIPWESSGHPDRVAWPGEIGVVQLTFRALDRRKLGEDVDTEAWWNWCVMFERGRCWYPGDKDALGDVVRVKPAI